MQNIKEFCYNFKYVAQNGRPDRNPWSIRQVGIYEKFNVETGQSVWIVLQPSGRVYDRLKEGISSKDWQASPVEKNGRAVVASVLIHAGILNTLGCEWGRYLEELNLQVQQLVRSVCTCISIV